MQMEHVRLSELLLEMTGNTDTVDAPLDIKVDPTLIRLLVCEGISNAKVHGRQNAPVRVIAKMSQPGTTNRLPAHYLHIYIVNANKLDMEPLTRAQCQRAFSREAQAGRVVTNLTHRCAS